MLTKYMTQACAIDRVQIIYTQSELQLAQCKE